MSVSPAKNLDPQLPREGITKRKLPHAGSILPWPWESKEREDLGSLGLGVRGEGGELGLELTLVRVSELLRERCKDRWTKRGGELGLFQILKQSKATLTYAMLVGHQFTKLSCSVSLGQTGRGDRSDRLNLFCGFWFHII